MEANQRQFRPKETEQLEKLGRFKAMVEEQARACWERNVDLPMNLVSDDDAAEFWRKMTEPAV